ncbi:MAG TPA: hypothetical protein VNA57_13450 [Acidimicrobiales bacterium]|nr:hypothetical protein [Acidimicrobiales bacterium]
MAEPRDAAPDMDEVIAQLRERVERRRQAGEYPEGLEDDLDRHFKRILAHRATPDHGKLQARVRELRELSFGRGAIATDSGMPGGAALHALVAKAVARQTEGILQQVRQLADATGAALDAVVASLEDPQGHVHADLVDQLDAVLDRLATFEKATRAGFGPEGFNPASAERPPPGEADR